MKHLRRGKSIVEVGELRRKIDICVREDVVDEETGLQKLDYFIQHSFRCKVKDESGKEFLSADREKERIRKKFFIRKRPNYVLDETKFINYQGWMYSVMHVVEIDDLFLEILAERVDNREFKF